MDDERPQQEREQEEEEEEEQEEASPVNGITSSADGTRGDGFEGEAEASREPGAEGIKRQKASPAPVPALLPSSSSCGDPSRSPGAPGSPLDLASLLSGSLTSSSPPRFVALEEMMKAANGVSNMYLAHEIAVDADFRLEKVRQEPHHIGGRIEDLMRKAFWEVLQSQLHEMPPNFKQALSLLVEIKESLLGLLLPQHTRLKQEIEEILDLDLVKQQAENGALDFQRYAQYVLSVMARLCAPVRDQTIRELTQTNDVVTLFRRIMELLDVMKLDMANFTIKQMRPQIQQQSVDYERKKFTEFLATQSKFSNSDGLEFTRKWLKRNYHSIDVSSETNLQQIINKVMTTAYVELLVWNESKQDSYPETLLMDENRFQEMRENVALYTLTGSVLLVTFATIGSSIEGLSEFKETLKQHLLLLLGDKSSDETNRLEGVAVQVISEVKKCLSERGFNPLEETKEALLETQIKEIANKENRVRSIIRRRLLEFVEDASLSNTATPLQIPSGLTVFQSELSALTGQFMKFVSHNRAVFGEYYADIISSLIQSSDPVQV